MDLTFIMELVGLFLTLMVMLYLFIGDNPLFRIVTYAFIGVAAGYVTVLVLFQVLIPRLLALVGSGNILFMGLGVISFLLGLLLFAKLSPRFSGVGTIPMAMLVGIGAAVAVGGAVFGTLGGQLLGTINLFNLKKGGDAFQLFEGLFILVGTISTLAYFQFGARSKAAAVTTPETAGEAESTPATRRDVFMEILSKVGQVFIGITLGAIFAGVYTAAISALIERIGFIWNIVLKFI